MIGSIVPVVFLLCSFCGVLALSGKGYFCRDPDTGKLYAVNTTWPATSFCGNYTCKIRTKILPKAETPLREFTVNSSITRGAKSKSAKEINELNNLEVAESKNIITTVYPTSYKYPSTTEINLGIHTNENIVNTKVSTDKDRYLTDSEIKTISKLLHNVKKSDLDAIVDIYNLAQDVYKEVDTIDHNDINKEPITPIKNKGLSLRSKSYWYEPLSRYDKANPDMDSQATVIQPNVAPTQNTYFQGPLMRNDFGVLPYYYPMSSFQRQSSYVHPLNAELANTPCDLDAPKLYATVVSPYPQVNKEVTKKPLEVEPQKTIQPTLLLPYPFPYMQHYNMSTYPYNSYYDNPLSSYDANINHGQLNKPVATNAKISDSNYKSEKETDSKPKKNDVSNNKLPKGKNLLDSLIENAKIQIKNPDWPTDPLSVNILEDIKSHFEEKSKLFMPFSVNKKKKLGRVGKVKRLDDIKRSKRSVGVETNLTQDEDSFEVFLEQTICRSDFDPGFYKMGNLTQPYPECCPQRIEDTISTETKT